MVERNAEPLELERQGNLNFTKRLAGMSVMILTLLQAVAWALVRIPHSHAFSPLFGKEDRGRDLTNYAEKFNHILFSSSSIGSGLPVFNYPAPSAFLYWLFLHGLGPHPFRMYLLVSVAAIIVLILLTFRLFRGVPIMLASAMAVFLLFSQPVLFTLDRGNIEVFVWIVSAVSIVALLSGRSRVAAIFLGLAMALKPFPALLLFLFLRLRRFKEALAACAIAAAAIVLALIGIGPNPVQAYRNLQPGVKIYLDHYVLQPVYLSELAFEHSLLDTEKTAVITVKARSLRAPVYGEVIEHIQAEVRETGREWRYGRPLLYSSMLFGLLLLSVSLYRLWRLPVPNSVVALGVLITLLPPVSAEYTLLGLIVPLGVVLWSAAHGSPEWPPIMRRTYIWTTVLLAALLSPITILRMWNSAFKCALLLTLLFVVLRYPLRRLALEDQTSSAG